MQHCSLHLPFPCVTDPRTRAALEWSERATAAVAGRSAARLCTNTTPSRTLGRCRQDPPRPGIWAETWGTPTHWAPWRWRLTWSGPPEWTRSLWCSWLMTCGGLQTSCTTWRRRFIAKVRHGQAELLQEWNVQWPQSDCCSKAPVVTSRCTLMNLEQT